VLASSCGDTHVDLIELLMLGLKWALTFVEDLPPNPVRGKSETYHKINNSSADRLSEPHRRA